jgi:phosphatidylserine/phosphatidylglycerophosphate/cardiolipin synthase-like enzyme
LRLSILTLLVCATRTILGLKVHVFFFIFVHVLILVDDVELWSHHEKVVVVDNHRACIGGLDICFGRWDTQNHPLADVHPTDFSLTLFPGQDYNNARVTDFQDVSNFVSETISVLETPRMPWHDVCLLEAPSQYGD